MITPEQVLIAARLAADTLLALVGHDDAKIHVDAAEKRRANALADAAEVAKFGRSEE